jgi:hypothetical protein
VKPDAAPTSPRRSAIGFALVVTAAIGTLAVAGLFVELRWYDAQSTIAQAAPAPIVRTPCPAGVDDPVQCPVPGAEH